MKLGPYLSAKVEELLPVPHELNAVEAGITNVENCLTTVGQDLRIAQRHRCGSYAKKTMLARRMEADVVVVLRDPPSSHILDRLQDAFSHHLRGVRRMEPKYKALEVVFNSGASVDVLPVASDGHTLDAGSVDERFRVGLNGQRHVEWFVQNAHGRVIHPTVRLLKAIREEHAAWKTHTTSFSLELAAVSALQGFRGGLDDALLHVLTRMKSDPHWLTTLSDPADPANRVLSRLGPAQLAEVSAVAARLLDAVERGNPSTLFSAAGVPGPSQNLGGRTLG